MKLINIVSQLMAALPVNTDKFTDSVDVISLVRAGTTITVSCSGAHNLKIGKPATILGAQTPIVISSLSRAGFVGTLVVASHDLTYAENNSQGSEIQISGAVESEFNGTFETISVESKTNITFIMLDAGPTVATGSPKLLNGFNYREDYNGTYAVTSVPSPSVFTYEHPYAGSVDPVGSIEARVSPRISAGSDIQRLQAAYTAQQQSKLWMFVTLGTVVASKSRAVNADFVDNLNEGHEYRQQLVQPFSVYLFIPASDDIAGRKARDTAEELFSPLCRSILGARFDSELAQGLPQGMVHFIDHDVLVYDSAIYVHEFQFAQIVDLTFEDTIGAPVDLRMTGFSLAMYPDFDLEGTPTSDVMTASGVAGDGES